MCIVYIPYTRENLFHASFYSAPEQARTQTTFPSDSTYTYGLSNDKLCMIHVCTLQSTLFKKLSKNNKSLHIFGFGYCFIL